MDATHAIVLYADSGNIGKGVCLTLSGTTVTAGAEFIFNNAMTGGIGICSVGSTKAIVTYRDIGNSNKGAAVCLTLSGTTVSVGAEFVFTPSSSTGGTVCCLSDSLTGKVIVCWDDNGSSTAHATCLSLSGTTISMGNDLNFGYNFAYIAEGAVCRVTSTTFVAIIPDNTGVRANTLSLSGTTLSAGATLALETLQSYSVKLVALNSTTVAAVYDYNSGNNGSALTCLTVSGTDLIKGPRNIILGNGFTQFGEGFWWTANTLFSPSTMGPTRPMVRRRRCRCSTGTPLWGRRQSSMRRQRTTRLLPRWTLHMLSWFTRMAATAATEQPFA
jgi:hypothetical protein